MSFEPTVTEQELLAESFRRRGAQMTRRDIAVVATLGFGFCAAVAAVWIAHPPVGFEFVPVALCVLTFALAMRVQFDTPIGFTVPTQLAFVPLLFATPIAVAPLAVLAAVTLSRVPDILRRRIAPVRLLQGIGDSWFAIGPVAVFAIADVAPSKASPWILITALAAQFVVDFGVNALRDGVTREADLVSQLRESWVYVIDAGLSPIALLVARDVQSSPAATLVVVPVLGLLAVFASERRARLTNLLELGNAYRGTALVLGDVVEADDGYTGEHCKSVVELALAVGGAMKLDPERLRDLEFGALLHDVGKIAIPKDIINKPGKLNPEEWTIIRTHTLEGQRMLNRVGGFMRDVGLIVRSHHERFDGAGYPDGLAGDQIPLESRIIACCDTWNAMRTDRVYRSALPEGTAIAEMQAVSGTQLDPEIADTLLHIVMRPDGTEPVEPTLTAPPGVELHPDPTLPTESPIDDSLLSDVRAVDPVERLLDESWEARDRRATRRELIAEAAAGGAFLLVAIPLALPAMLEGRVPLGTALLLVFLYALVRTIRFQIGVGAIVPSYLVLVPMLILLPPSTVPLLAGVGLVLGTSIRVLAERSNAQALLFSVPDGWHTIGPAVVLMFAGHPHGGEKVAVYLGALAAGFLVDLVSSTLREWLALGVAPRLQVRVITLVWVVDAAVAPLGYLIAEAARPQPARLLLLVPLFGLLHIVDRDRTARIAEAQHRLRIVARERTRLQAAVRRLGDAFAAKLDLGALTNVLLGGSIDALDADAGRLVLTAPRATPIVERRGPRRLDPLLLAADAAATSDRRARQLEADGDWAIVLPFTFGESTGCVAVARRGRSFRPDEHALLRGLVERAGRAAAEIVAHETLREQAMTDALTRLGNRRRLSTDLGGRLVQASPESPVLLMLFDLDGFKAYNDTFGHIAGDALLARLGHKLQAAVSGVGDAYRLGGDEFCVLMPVMRDGLYTAVSAAVHALEERGETFAVTASCGTVLLPHEARTVDYALQLADERMYARKNGRHSGAREQAHDVLLQIVRANQPDLPPRADGVARLALPVGRRLGLAGEELDELARAAALHDVGKVGLPEAILTKAGPLDPEEWSFVRQHTVLGERILNAAPALRPVAAIVRASHERWDGDGYPDGLRGDEIPPAARIIAACDAYVAMTSDRCYRAAMSETEAREELRREAGKQFDPAVVSAVLRELGRPSGAPRPPTAEPGEAQDSAFAAEVVAHVTELLQTADGRSVRPVDRSRSGY